MKNIIIMFFSYYLTFYFFNRLLFWFRGRKGLLGIKKSVEVSYLMNKYQLNIEKIGVSKIVNLIALSNALILTINLMILQLLGLSVLALLLCFLITMMFIFFFYHLIGRYYQKKGMINDV